MEDKIFKADAKQLVVMPSLHRCDAGNDIDVDAYGIAIDSCWEDAKDGKLWVGNAEYANTVKYCPFCGYKSNVA